MRKIRRVGTTCWDYQAKENDELCEDGWVMARIDKKKGMVPGNYVNLTILDRFFITFSKVVLVGSGPNLINSEDVKRADLLASGGFANVFRGYYKNQVIVNLWFYSFYFIFDRKLP
uniref:Pyr_redox_2 domain-containing protein n=1 Tax=Meloidogyne hapla TaxID=6305 RepID=A0A1I8B1K1_MELHA